MNYVWVVVGEASGLPVYASTNKYLVFGWLQLRNHPSLFRVFRLVENRLDNTLEVCIPCLLDNPNMPVKGVNHDVGCVAR